VAIPKLRANGLQVGLLSLKMFRPFPAASLREFFKETSNIVVFDRDIGYGYEGVLSYELKSALFGLKNPPFIKGFIVGLGGRDVTTNHILEGVQKSIEAEKKGEISNKTEFLGVKLAELQNYDESNFYNGD
ncbi:MAG: hypothetical protein EU532_12360, partial [Promethearchaeota archaeon]